MTELFPIYEDSFKIITKKVIDNLENYTNISRDKHEIILKEAENNVKELERIVYIDLIKLMQMDLELANKKNQKNNLNNIQSMKLYKNEIDIIKKRVMKAQDNFYTKKSHDELLGGLRETSNNEQQMQKLIEKEELAWKQHSNLEHAKRASIEMENISIEVLRNLDHNTQNMKGINSKVSDLTTELDYSSSIMGRILKKENRNKVIIAVFSIVLFILFILFIYFKFFN